MSEHEYEINRVLLSGRVASDPDVREPPVVSVFAPTLAESLTFRVPCPYRRMTINSAPARLEPPGADTEGIGFYALGT